MWNNFFIRVSCFKYIKLRGIYLSLQKTPIPFVRNRLKNNEKELNFGWYNIGGKKLKPKLNVTVRVLQK